MPYIAEAIFSRTFVSGNSQYSSIAGIGPFTTEYAMPQPNPSGAPGKTRESPINKVR